MRKLGAGRRYRKPRATGKNEEEASDKHGKAWNLSIKSSTKARSELGKAMEDWHKGKDEPRREEYAGESRLMSETRQRMKKDRGIRL